MCYVTFEKMDVERQTKYLFRCGDFEYKLDWRFLRIWNWA